MKTGAIAVALLISLTGGAFAIDPAFHDTSPSHVGFNWTGGYIGLHAGAGWSKVDQPFINYPYVYPLDVQDNADGSGFLGGVHAGYNWQSGSLVFGLEADVDATSIDGQDAGSGGDINGFKARWTASLRGRIGYAFDQWLIYGTGGYAYLNGQADVRDPGYEEEHTASFHGWTVGAGAEYALTKNITLRGEYRFADFRTKPVFFSTYVEEISPRIQSVRLGLSYKF